MKTKLTQHSVKELRSIGIQPDILLCRAERDIPETERKKIALFTNVEEKAVISAIDADNIYRIPLLLHAQGLDSIVVEKFNLDVPAADLSEWQRVVDSITHPKYEVTVAMVGKYVDLTESYKSLNEALAHAGIQTQAKVNIVYVDSEALETDGIDSLKNIDAILVPGGFGERGVEGKIKAVQYARENNVPYLGICLGMQVAVIEYARHKANLENAHSTEFNKQTEHPVIALITEWLNAAGKRETRDEDCDVGGTMRLGGQECRLKPGTHARDIYQQDVIVERHRHRYEFNNRYLEQLEQAGLVFSGMSIDETLVEVVELKEHPWFIACQFHPEFTSSPRRGHPLFTSYIQAALNYQESKK